MVKPANKTPTIQDLSRDELLLLFGILNPATTPELLLRVQEIVACRAVSSANAASWQAFDKYQAAHDLATACKAGSSAERKALRACEAARDARQALDRRAKRTTMRWKRLSDQLVALSAAEG